MRVRDDEIAAQLIRARVDWQDLQSADLPSRADRVKVKTRFDARNADDLGPMPRQKIGACDLVFAGGIGVNPRIGKDQPHRKRKGRHASPPLSSASKLFPFFVATRRCEGDPRLTKAS